MNAPRTHVVLAGSERPVLPGARALGRSNPHQVIEITLKLRRANPLPALSHKAVPPMTRQDLASRHGASAQDIASVSAAFAAFGLKTLATHAATRTVRVSGSIAAVEAAFQVHLFDYAHPGGAYRGRVGSLQVPVAVQDIVVGAFGLDTRRAVRRRRQPPRDAHPGNSRTAHDDSGSGSGSGSGAVPDAWYRPADLAAHYQFPDGDGGGETIGVLEFGGGYFESDLQQFCTLCGIAPLPTVSVVSVDGTSTSAKDGAEGEVMLDVEILAGLCPNAKIVAYFAQFTIQGWIAALDAAVHDLQNAPGVISVSWGFAENNDVWTQQGMQQVNETLLEAAHLGLTVCVAAGDDGSSDAISDGKAYADFPCSSPYALAVGGTTIPAKGVDQPDVVWKLGDGLRADNGGSTGGGVSSVFARPDWQSAVEIASVNAGALVGRVVPDLSANADWTGSPYLMVVDGDPGPNGGTSAAAPLVAGLLTRINAAKVAAGLSRVGFLTPQLYQASPGSPAGSPTVGSQGCTDVTSGDNNTAAAGGYAAGAGYDAASGWGTPIGTALAQLLP